MTTPYQTSMVLKYGDVDNVPKDVKTLNDIIDRQGITLLIDVIAEYVGQRAIAYKWTSLERRQVMNQYVEELREAIIERT